MDAGKTTLSEAMLYQAGSIRKLGRVDHGDAFLDTDAQERARGITIFSKQAELHLGGAEADIMLLDTPGHVDFSAEMERTLQVLDYGILIISGRDGVQGHTVTLWNLLQHHEIPVFLFINKMDMDGTDRGAVLEDLRQSFGSGFATLDDPEEMATCSEEMLDEFLEEGIISDASIAKAIANRQLFSCFFGSALKLEGVEELLHALNTYTLMPDYGKAFSARVFKITRDPSGNRLTHMKITGGSLKVRDVIETVSAQSGEAGSAKVNQIRIYSGEKFRTEEKVQAGSICAVTGLEDTFAGQVLGQGAAEESGEMGRAAIEPVLSANLILPEGTNQHEAFLQLKVLEEEDPQLHITWNEQTQQIQFRIMGEVQTEILQKIIEERFGMKVAFGDSAIAYKETIRKPVVGSGHFEPLRHYAEVHLLMQPLPEGSGLVFDSACSEDVLDRNWQRLITTHLVERDHPGVLTGSPITDMRITILAGRAHLKHTEGGDFRQATYRAIRQGLRKSLAAGNAVLLEPWYRFQLQIPQNMIGRAMADVQRMGGTIDQTTMTGMAPVSEMKDYATEVAAYTGGFGRLVLQPGGYRACHNQDEVVGEIGYDPDRDVDNPADSVFCSHGAGHPVDWDQADDWMHVSFRWTEEEDDVPAAPAAGGGSSLSYGGSREEDKELQRIFDRTFVKSERKKRQPEIGARLIESEQEKKRHIDLSDRNLEEYVLVDGYNIIFAWDELKELAEISIDGAREALIDILRNYQGFKGGKVIVVFDAYKVKGGERHVDEYDQVSVVYTAEAETADTYIERTTYQLAGKGIINEEGRRQKYKVRVATSDRLEQLIIMGNNASKVSAKDFRKEVEQIEANIQEAVARRSLQNQREHANKLGDYMPKDCV